MIESIFLFPNKIKDDNRVRDFWENGDFTREHFCQIFLDVLTSFLDVQYFLKLFKHVQKIFYII